MSTTETQRYIWNPAPPKSHIAIGSIILESGADIDPSKTYETKQPLPLLSTPQMNSAFLVQYPLIVCILCAHEMTRRLI